MGEAKRREASYEAAKGKLLRSLAGDGLVVAETAIKLFEGFIFPERYTGGCYLTNMILHRFLKDERHIETEVVVGYINDGSDDIFISHAWLEHGGSKTDLTIYLTHDASLQGGLLVCDELLRPGSVTYTYHRQQTEAGRREEITMMRNLQLAPIVAHKAQEHRGMLLRAENPSLMKAYLDSAPPEQGYEAMASVLR
jgi:hypothetical protein